MIARVGGQMLLHQNRFPGDRAHEPLFWNGSLGWQKEENSRQGVDGRVDDDGKEKDAAE